MTMTLRLLPATLAAVGVLLGFKTITVWQTIDGVTASVAIPQARAETTKNEAGKTDTGKHEPAKGEAAKPPAGDKGGEASAAGEGGAGKEHGKGAGKTPPPAPAAIASTPADAPGYSPAEVEVLQQLGKRREAIEARAADIDRRETLLKAAEARIDDKAKELEALRDQLEHLIKGYDEQRETKIRSLVKIYENMKPADAARIFEELDPDTLLLVAERMKERKLALVMAEINPGKAKEITEQLAKLKELMLDKQTSTGRSG